MQKSIIVVGDTMLDRYVAGEVNKIAAEAPCPIVNVKATVEVPGGAANVAMNLVGLGHKVHLITVLGGRQTDYGTEGLKTSLADVYDITLHAYHTANYKTPVKTRLTDEHGKQLLRYDEQNGQPLVEPATQQAILKTFNKIFSEEQADGISCVVLSDYNKATLIDDFVATEIIERATAAEVPIVVDPKSNSFLKYSGATILKPNAIEAALVCGCNYRSPAQCAEALAKFLRLYNIKSILLTAGIDGMYLIRLTEEDIVVTEKIPSYPPREVFSSVGAGDTVIACLAHEFSKCNSNTEVLRAIPNAARRASVGAGITVSKAGTYTLNIWEYLAELAELGFEKKLKHIDDVDGVKTIITEAKNRGEKIVLTNGCFDMLHPGHIHLLTEARKCGDLLIVAVNSDGSVRRLKGGNRPLMPLAHRIEMLSALACVDVIISFDEDTPGELIDSLDIDVLVKGADYAKDLSKIAGSKSVLRNGGEIKIIELLPEFGTSKTINKIRASA